MWTWVSEDAAKTDRMLDEVVAPLLRRDPDELRDRLCIGSAEHCAQVLSDYAASGMRVGAALAAGRRAPADRVVRRAVIPQITV